MKCALIIAHFRMTLNLDSYEETLAVMITITKYLRIVDPLDAIVVSDAPGGIPQAMAGVVQVEGIELV